LADRLLLALWAATGAPAISRLVSPSEETVVHAIENVVVPSGGRLPLVVTVHDLAAIEAPELAGSRVKWLVKMSWRRRQRWDAVIVPSNATASVLSERGVPQERIHLIRHGVSPEFRSQIEPAADERAKALVGERPYVLVVGPATRRKGADILLRAWSEVRARVDGTLVWVGPRDHISAGAVPAGVLPLGPATDFELAALYGRAVATVCASRYEGYSFPVAESLSLGTPVIASDIPAHREFGSESLVLVPTENHGALAGSMRSAFRGDLRRQRVAFPSRVDCARAHIDLYRRLFT
jgi:glycosyltransferase involved in cell wall biosynthesis